MRYAWVWATIAALAIGGCDPVEAPPPEGDAGPPPDSLDAGSAEVPDDTVVLELDDNGDEVGAAALGDDGVARFYSESRRAFWEYEITPAHDEAVASETEVHVAVSPDGRASYFVYDPTGATMPYAFAAMLPESGEHTADVDPLALERMNSTDVEFHEMPGDPFGDFTIAGISVSISIQGLARSIVEGAIISAFTSLIGGACNTLAPLHTEICDVIVAVADFMANLVSPGASLLRGGPIDDFAYDIAGDLLGEVADLACTPLGQWIGKPHNEGAGIDEVRRQYRIAVTEYHYLLWQLEENPPADPADRAEMRQALVHVGAQLSTIGPNLREGYVNIHDLDAAREGRDPSPMSYVADATHRLINAVELKHHVWEDVFTDVVAEAMFGPLPTGGIVWVDVPVERVQVSVLRVRDLKKAGLALGALNDCAVAVFQGYEGQVDDDGFQMDAEATMETLFGQAIRGARAVNQDLYTEHYGGGDIPTPCLFDEYEPNGTWQQAVANPSSISVGGGPVWLRDLTLCTVGGTPIEEDWYAFPMGAIEFNVQARVRTPENMDFAAMHAGGDDEPICVELFYYGQTNELAGLPPTSLYGACGTPSDVWTGSAGVRRAIGEAWSYILVHVRAESGAMDPVAYDLGFAE